MTGFNKRGDMFLLITSGNTQDGNSIPIPKSDADQALMRLLVLVVGRVAACKNASAMLFTSAKVSQYALLPQGQVERANRAKSMLKQMDMERIWELHKYRGQEAQCPKDISIENIARLNREFLFSK